MIDVVDGPGRLPKALMRQYFEGMVQQTKVLKDTPLGTVTLNGTFRHYADPDTDTMWLGFALGMRCAERVARQAMEPEPSGTADGGIVEGWSRTTSGAIGQP